MDLNKVLEPNVQNEIEAACLDYVAGFYERSSERLTRGVHPELAKRHVRENQLRQMSRDELIEVAMKSRKDAPQITVEILDVFGQMASAKVVSDFVDYVHLAVIDGRWQIVNALWDWAQPRA